MEVSKQQKKIELPYESVTPLLGTHREEMKPAHLCSWQRHSQEPRHGQQIDILLDIVDEQPVQATEKIKF